MSSVVRVHPPPRNATRERSQAVLFCWKKLSILHDYSKHFDYFCILKYFYHGKEIKPGRLFPSIGKISQWTDLQSVAIAAMRLPLGFAGAKLQIFPILATKIFTKINLFVINCKSINYCLIFCCGGIKIADRLAVRTDICTYIWRRSEHWIASVAWWNVGDIIGISWWDYR